MVKFKKRAYRYLLPNLLEIQRLSFCWFLERGFMEELDKITSICYDLDDATLNLLSKLYSLRQPHFSFSESKRKETTYSIRIFTQFELSYVIAVNSSKAKKNLEREKIRNEILLCELPLMTNAGTFLVKGVDRIIINQIVRSPGVYFTKGLDQNDYPIYVATLVSNRGAWVKFEIDKDDKVNVKMGKTTTVSAYVFLRTVGFKDKEISSHLTQPEFFVKTCSEYDSLTFDESFIKLYKQLRPGEPSTVEAGQHLLYSKFFDPRRYDLGFVGRHKINVKLDLNVHMSVQILTTIDIINIINELINFRLTPRKKDDIDHFGNRRIRSVGELLQNQIRIGLNRLERIAQERMSDGNSTKNLRIKKLVNAGPLSAALREFFGSNPLSQFMNQTNPLAELTQKRRLSVLGPGGISKEQAGFVIRDIHPSQYGRICPVDTPEGPNAGLVGTLAIYGRINSYGFIETPYYRVKRGKVFQNSYPIYLEALVEENYKIATSDVKISLNGILHHKMMSVRDRQDLVTINSNEIDYIAISPIQVISLATSLIPFLEHDDATRALMGGNMQRQSVPLMYSEAPLIGTGLEIQTARDSERTLVSLNAGKIREINDGKIRVSNKKYHEFIYSLLKYQRSNQGTCLTQRVLVSINEKVFTGYTLADGAATEGGELAVGQNIVIAYMPWEGYNYEDAVVISERLLYDDLYTSLHITKFEMETRHTKLGLEKVTRELPNVSEQTLTNLDENGVIKIGTWVTSGDILVGKVTPKKESKPSPELKLLEAIHGKLPSNVRNTSLKVSNEVSGRVLDVKILSLSGRCKMFKIYIALTRKLQLGDKMAGRHGNKGIISKILQTQDMPYLPNGTPIDMLLNPLGVPSRMNVGQLFECLLGFAANTLNIRFKVIPFDEIYGMEASRALINQKLKAAANFNSWIFSSQFPGKIMLSDGRTGKLFENPITVGLAYILKLIHLVDDKIHSRSTASYSLITQQPLGGRANRGGQRLGEMEVWALEAFGAAYTLEELLTLKSDDMLGRTDTLASIVKGCPIPRPGIPESFKVLMRELHALCLDIATYKVEVFNEKILNHHEIDILFEKKDN
jgi:DNA-directed RNA polymerase subunit beta